MCGHHDYFGGLCPPSSHFTASDFIGSDNTEVIKMCSRSQTNSLQGRPVFRFRKRKS